MTAPAESGLHAPPPWLPELLGTDALVDDATIELSGQSFVVRDGIARSKKLLTAALLQTRDTFGFKWSRRDSFDSATARARSRKWLVERYGDIANAPWLSEYGASPLLIDAGCGGGLAALELWGELIPPLRYLGIDVSDAVDVARARFEERGLHGGFLQADITDLPFEAGSVDLIFSEGVLHHTNSTEAALRALAPLLKTNGRILFYVYRVKGPIREFTDDFVRARLQAMTPEQAWRAVEPLTRLGIALGELNAEIDVPEPIELLGIPSGRFNVQRLVYWYVAKMFYAPELTFDEMNHINFDWYAPANAHRQSPEDVRRWCEDCGLIIEREVIEDAGITIIARRA